MDEHEKLIKDRGWEEREPFNGLFSLSPYIGCEAGDSTITLDGDFSLEELEAITWWIKTKKEN